MLYTFDGEFAAAKGVSHQVRCRIIQWLDALFVDMLSFVEAFCFYCDVPPLVCLVVIHIDDL